MSSDKETRLFGAQIDKETHDILDSRLEYGEKSRLVRDLANTIAYGESWDERTPLDIQIQNVEQQLADARSRRRAANTDIEDLEDELERLREMRENRQTREELLEASLVSVESDLRGGMHVDPDHGGVKSVAREYDIEVQAVLDRLKSRNPDVPDYAFDQRMHSPEPWDGVPVEERNTPVENRESLYR